MSDWATHKMNGNFCDEKDLIDCANVVMEEINGTIDDDRYDVIEYFKNVNKAIEFLIKQKQEIVEI
jgi:hypothetical protein